MYGATVSAVRLLRPYAVVPFVVDRCTVFKIHLASSVVGTVEAHLCTSHGVPVAVSHGTLIISHLRADGERGRRVATDTCRLMLKPQGSVGHLAATLNDDLKAGIIHLH